ncbi:MAG TPA: DUF4238 domain-containing protein [Candidatus Binatia bacterium]
MPVDDTDIVYAELVRRDQAAASEHGRRLARLWAQQLSGVIKRVFEISQRSGRVAWHVDARTEAIFEMARLLNWLGERIVDRGLNGRAVAHIDIAEEQAVLDSPQGIERIENTAQIVAERIWNRVYDKLQEKYPLVQEPGVENTLPRLPGRLPRRRQRGTKDNHFVPRFTIRPWAGADGQVREFRRLSGGRIHSRLRPYARWGFEHFLYPQGLEEYFQRVESRVAAPYRQVLQYLPLTPHDRYFWISFLILQHLRTPAFMATLAAGLSRRIKAERWAYPTTPEAMRRAYLTLFGEDKVFSAYYSRINERRWHLLVPSAGMSFPRTDVPIVITGEVRTQAWRCVYPLSPARCFQVGPERAAETDVPFALSQTLSLEETIGLNNLLLSQARRSVVVRPTDDPGQWSHVIDRALVRTSTAEEYQAWGSLEVKS